MGWTGVDISNPLLPEVVPEIDANPVNFYSGGGMLGVGLSEFAKYGTHLIIKHDRITTQNVEYFLNAFQLTMLLLHIRVHFYFVQEITNFGNFNTISIFTILTLLYMQADKLSSSTPSTLSTSS